MFFPDFNEMKKYTGVMALKNFELIRDDLAQKHLLDLAPEYVQASGRFAVRLYKEEIEVLLRTPGYAGFSLLDLHDYPTQGTALIGLLDPFWDSKGFIQPEAFRRFCGPTVPLLRMPKRTYTVDEPFAATADLANYGPGDIASEPVWTIKDQQGREVASGRLPAVNAPTGKLTALGAINASLAKAAAPAKLTVTVALPGTEFANDWDIWVYPANVTPKPPQTWSSARVGSRRKRRWPRGRESCSSRSPRTQRNRCAALSCQCFGARCGFPVRSRTPWACFAIRRIRCSRSFPRSSTATGSGTT